MAGNSSFLRCSVEGVDEMKKVLGLIGEDLRKRTVQAALRDALVPVAAEAKRLAPQGRDDFARAVSVLVGEQFKTVKGFEFDPGAGQTVTVRAGRKGNTKLRRAAFKLRALRDTIVITSQLSQSQRRRRGGRLTEYEAFVSATAPHAHLVEFGHALVKSRRTAGGRTKAVIGHVPAYPFLRPAFDARKGEVLQLFVAAIGKRMSDLVARLGRQAVKNTLSKSNRRALAMLRSSS